MSDKNQVSIEKESLTKSKTDNTEPTVFEVQINVLEPEKINVPSSENDYANLSAEKAKDSKEPSLKSTTETSPSAETSLTKTHETVEESIEKESLTKSEIKTTELTVSQEQRIILEPEKINAFDFLEVTFMSTSNDIKKRIVNKR